MYKTFKISIVITLFYLFQSCNNKNECDEPTILNERTCKKKLSEEAFRSLNLITKILNSSNYLKNNDEESSIALLITNEIFFNLDNSNNLFFKISYYGDYSKTKIRSYSYYEVPINEIDITNITTSDSVLLKYGEITYVTINSKFNNDKAFRYSLVSYDNNNNLEYVKCSESSEITFSVSSSEAQLLKNSFLTFVSNIHE